jgi:uncharacterized metal-binding protein
MQSLKRDCFPILIIMIMIAVMTIPYIIAACASGNDYIFGGFLFNPIDGNSYLAKMYQGWEGDWRFRLPYTAEMGEGGYLFLFYIFIGHISRLLGTSLIITFHCARVIGVVIMLIALYRFYDVTLIAKQQVKIAYLLAVFGSGAGWIAMMFGGFTSDFWVAEAFPFLSSYANPHFPLGLAILLWLITPSNDNQPIRKRRGIEVKWIQQLVGAILLGLIMPFGIVIGILILTGLTIWEIIERYRLEKSISISLFPKEAYTAIIICIGGGPVLIYDYLISTLDPILAGWNKQNLTPSPEFWDFVIAFLPVLIFALPGVIMVLSQKRITSRILFVWSLIGCIVLLIPFGLQRRFILGLYVPLAGLASIGIAGLLARQKREAVVLTVFIVTFACLTNLFILLASFEGVRSLNNAIYMTKGEFEALQWVSENTSKEAIILAGPETGLLIPAYTGRRVLYGHPFETIDAESQEQKVINYFKDPDNEDSLKLLGNVDYVFWGPREEELFDGSDIRINLNEIYMGLGVRIYLGLHKK